MHARRKFEQAAMDGAKNGKTMASKVMDIYKKLYESEEKIREYSADEKVKARMKEQKPLLEEIKALAPTWKKFRTKVN